MRQFLTTILYIIIALGFVNSLAVFFIPSRAEQYYGEVKEATHPKVIVLGDSHAWYVWASHNNPDVLNLSFVSDNVVDMNNKAHYVFDHISLDSLQLIIIQAEPYLISNYRELTNNNVLSYNYFDYPLKSSITYNCRFLFDVSTRTDIGNGFNSGFNKIQAKRCLENELQLASNYDSSLFTNRLARQYPENSVSEALSKKYEGLIAFLKAKNVSVVALSYPIYPYYSYLLDKKEAYHELQEELNNIIARNKMDVIDCSNIYSQKELFCNQDHLNCMGSKLFIKHIDSITQARYNVGVY